MSSISITLVYKMKDWKLKNCSLHVENEANLLSASNLNFMSVDLQGHVAKGKTQFLHSESCNLIASCYTN